MKALFPVLASLIPLSGCGERVPQDQGGQGSTTPPYVRPAPEPLSVDRTQPVRTGEMGPGFAACSGRGMTRDRVAGGPVAVRAAPYDQDEVIDRLAPRSQFFICSRTHDQRWFGIVYDEGGQATERCGVSRPAPAPSTYRGPCAAGWVSSSEVQLDSGVPLALPPAPPRSD